MKGISVLLVVCLLLGASWASPAFLSQYLPDNYAAGQAAASVSGIDYAYPSYSGYLTVNETYNSNMFFWYFPAQSGITTNPVLLWLNGGPGFTSLFGLFNENGPFTVPTLDFDLAPNPYTWATNFSVVWVDNPVGVGFSFTDDPRGMATNENDVANNMYNFVSQFFQLFPELQSNDFYICGESYAGKYVPASVYKIYQMNQDPSNTPIPLKGFSVGDGIMDPQTQTQGIASLCYHLSMFDYNEMTQGKAYESALKMHIEKGEFFEAFLVWDEYINGDFYPYPTFFTNKTGETEYYNFLEPEYPANYWIEYLNLPSTQEALHTQSKVFIEYNATVEKFLVDDWMRSIAYTMPTLLENYRVMIYNGQNDIVLGPACCENFLRTIEWSGQLDYLAAEKIIWMVDGDVAGYVRNTGEFYQVVVSDAGHLVPEDQPVNALNMITNFVLDLPF